MLGRIRQHFANHNWGILLTELFVLILGILLAFQIDRWGEEKRDARLEAQYLQRLADDLTMEIQRMDEASEYANDRIEAADLLLKVIENPEEAAGQTSRLPWAVETATWRSFPHFTAFVYNELTTTGNLSLVRDEILRRMLAEHYSTIRHESRVGLDLTAQHEFERQTYGVLNREELENVETVSWDGTPIEITAIRAMEIAESLRARPEAVAVIPSLVQHHTFNIRVIDSARTRAQAIIERIDSQQ